MQSVMRLRIHLVRQRGVDFFSRNADYRRRGQLGAARRGLHLQPERAALALPA